MRRCRIDFEPLDVDLLTAGNAIAELPFGKSLERGLDPLERLRPTTDERLRHLLCLQRIHARKSSLALLIQFDWAPTLLVGGLVSFDLVAQGYQLSIEMVGVQGHHSGCF